MLLPRYRLAASRSASAGGRGARGSRCLG